MKTYPLECVDLMKRARIAFQAGRTLKEGFRLAQLEAVVQLLEDHECDFVDALGRDLHKVRGDLQYLCLKPRQRVYKIVQILFFLAFLCSFFIT